MKVEGLAERIDVRLSRGRAAADARLAGAGRATIRRRTGRKVQNESTGAQEPEWLENYTELPCRIGGQRGAGPSQTIQVPGGEMQMGARVAHFPVSTTNLRDGDLIEVTAGELAGTVWRIVEADHADQQTARRVPVVAVDRPEEWS